MAILFDVIADPDRSAMRGDWAHCSGAGFGSSVMTRSAAQEFIISSDSSPARDRRLITTRGEAAAHYTCDRRFVINDQNSPRTVHHAPNPRQSLRHQLVR